MNEDAQRDEKDGLSKGPGRVRKKTSLAIVERSYRGALEEQYGNIVWLSESLRSMRAEHNLLLCGSAVACAFDGQKRQNVKLGDITVSTVAHYPDAVRSLLEIGARIWVLKKDLDQFEGTYNLIPGVELADSLYELVAAHDKAWFW